MTFYGPQDEESLGTPTLGDSDLDAAGLLRCPNVYLKPTEYVHQHVFAGQKHPNMVHDPEPHRLLRTSVLGGLINEYKHTA